MERHRRVAGLWNWLPAFRGVAEYQSIHKAAAELAISPSALSRSVRLLEEAVGHSLFLRQGAGLRLTAFGQELFLATKESMRRIDDTLARSADPSTAELVSVGVSTPMLLTLVEAAAVALLLGVGPRVRAVMLPEDDAVTALLDGSVDVVVGFQQDRHPELRAVIAGELHTATFHATPGLRERFVAVGAQASEREDLSTAVLVVASPAAAACAALALNGYCILPEFPLPFLEGLYKGPRVTTDPVYATRRKSISPVAVPSPDLIFDALQNLLMTVG